MKDGNVKEDRYRADTGDGKDEGGTEERRNTNDYRLQRWILRMDTLGIARTEIVIRM